MKRLIGKTIVNAFHENKSRDCYETITFETSDNQSFCYDIWSDCFSASWIDSNDALEAVIGETILDVIEYPEKHYETECEDDGFAVWCDCELITILGKNCPLYFGFKFNEEESVVKEGNKDENT